MQRMWRLLVELHVKLIALSLMAYLVISCSWASGDLTAEGWRARWVGAHQKIYNLEEKIMLSTERVAELKGEVKRLLKNEQQLTVQINKVARKIEGLALSLAEAKDRFYKAYRQQQAQLVLLDQQEKKLSDILVLLQKLQKSPPPSLLINYSDSLKAFRGSLLMGSLMPEIHQRAQGLKQALEKLEVIAKELESKYQTIQQIKEEQEALNLKLVLLQQEDYQLLQSKRGLVAEEEQASKLYAKQRAELTALVTRLKEQQKQLAAPKRPADIQRLVFEKNALRFPPGAKLIKKAGDKRFGLEYAQGEVWALKPAQEIVFAAQGFILYAGDFRKYQSLLVIELGSGYQLIVAGMKKLYVKENQFVNYDVKLGIMPEEQEKETEPFLYIELVKNGKSVGMADYKKLLWKRGE